MFDLKRYISDKRLTQKTFAAQIGIAEGHLSRIMTGKYPVVNNLIEKIEEVIGKIDDGYFSETSTEHQYHKPLDEIPHDPDGKQIPFYDEKLDKHKSQELTQLSISQSSHFFTDSEKTKEVFVNLGNLYLQVFEPILEKLSQTNSVVFTSGSSGKRLAEMHDWLYGENSPLRNEQNETKLTEVYIQGIRLQTNEAQIRAIIQKEITQNGIKDLQNFQSWFVPIDEMKVSPKWLISRLTGLPVSKFHSDQARKVLQKLGIKVQRV